MFAADVLSSLADSGTVDCTEPAVKTDHVLSSDKKVMEIPTGMLSLLTDIMVLC